MYRQCKICSGTGKIEGLGYIQQICDECNGVGRIKLDAEEAAIERISKKSGIDLDAAREIYLETKKEVENDEKKVDANEVKELSGKARKTNANEVKETKKEH